MHNHYYDYDGNEIRSESYKGCVINSNNQSSCAGTDTTVTRCSSTASAKPIGTTCKYYDGLDRLVETAQPYDDRTFTDSGKTYEFYTYRWMNRYIYDLTLSGSGDSLDVSDQTGSTPKFSGYGNLYRTEEYLYQGNSGMRGCIATTDKCGAPTNGQYTSASWSDVRGTSFDSLDRPVSKYELAYGPPETAVTTNSYDAAGQAGLLSSEVNGVNQTITYVYDGISRVQNRNFSSGDGDNRSYQYDADGRTASITGHTFGTMSYTYDADGNELTVTEPSNSNGPQHWTAGSFICYEYYLDGLREYLTIGDEASGSYSQCGDVHNGNPNDGGINQHRIISYAYTPDSRLMNEEVKWGANGQVDDVFSWLYKPSGREIQEIDPLNNGVAQTPGGGTPRTIHTKVYAYGQYGRVNGVTQPGGYQESSLVYDIDDELAGYTAGNSASRTMLLNARGEVMQDTTNGDAFSIGTAQGESQSANGAQVGSGIHLDKFNNPVQNPPTTIEYDLRSNMVTCSTDPSFASAYSSGGINTIFPYVYKYDAAGRQFQTGFDTSGTPGINDTTCDASKATLATSTYDAENHIESSNIYSGGLTTGLNAVWGPDGRQRIGQYQDQYGNKFWETAHWDGGSLLFATVGSQGAQLYIGKLGVVDYAGDLDVYDRDQTGAAVSHHGLIASTSSYWIDGWSTGSVRTITSYKSGQQYYLQFFIGTCNAYFKLATGQMQWFPCPAGATFEMGRADGYSMVGGIVQGARTYDPTSGQWLTPDAYAGTVSDPMSQKPFIWNGNNAVQFNDPTGYTIDWSNVPDDELEEITNLRLASPTFENEIDQMESSTNVYTFTSTSTLGGNVQGQFDPNSGTISIGANITGDTLDGVLAHEVAHAADDAEGVYDVLSAPPSLPGTSGRSAQGEDNTDEEAHGYMMEFKVLSEVFGSQKATGVMQDEMPYWGGAEAGSNAWTMDQITRSFCSSMPGYPPC